MNKRLHFWMTTLVMLMVAYLIAQTPATALNFDGPVSNAYDYITGMSSFVDIVY